MYNLTWLLKEMGGKLLSRYKAAMIRPHYCMAATTLKFNFLSLFCKKIDYKLVNYDVPPRKKPLEIYSCGKNNTRKSVLKEEDYYLFIYLFILYLKLTCI